MIVIRLEFIRRRDPTEKNILNITFKRLHVYRLPRSIFSLRYSCNCYPIHTDTHVKLVECDVKNVCNEKGNTSDIICIYG